MKSPSVPMQRGIVTEAAILQAGVELARGGLHQLKGRTLGKKLRIAHTLINYHFGGMAEFKAKVIATAIQVNDTKVIARLVMDDHPSVKHLTRDQRRQYLAAIGR